MEILFFETHFLAEEITTHSVIPVNPTFTRKVICKIKCYTILMRITTNKPYSPENNHKYFREYMKEYNGTTIRCEECNKDIHKLYIYKHRRTLKHQRNSQ